MRLLYAQIMLKKHLSQYYLYVHKSHRYLCKYSDLLADN